ncbi:MAG TPA: cytochrome P450 [Mycobacteriales bacterium]|nr:cytochrome P450 [Mycobacteriales bacterium]
MSVAAAVQSLRSEAGRNDPYPIYAELHAHGPVNPIEAGGDERYQFTVNGYDAVNEVLRDPAFLVTDGAMVERTGLRWRQHPCLTALLTSMFFSNEPDHTRLRTLYNRAITPRRVARLEQPIADIVDRLLDRMAERGADGSPVDFMAEFALLVPGDVICELMGVPDENRAWFIERTHIFADLLDLGRPTPELLAAGDAATVELTSYFAELVRLRQTDPRDDMITSFAEMLAGDEDVDEAELLAGLITFFNAGFATTSHLLGNGLPKLVDDPDLAEAVRTSGTAAAGFVEEILRHSPPTHLVVRVAAADRELAGVRIPAGSRLLVLTGAGNVDPARFPDPRTFDAYRPDNRPLTFGAGPHFCLGAALTRLEGQVAFPRIVGRFPKLALAGGSTRTNRLTLSGFQTLPVTVA